jgi:hypothetical protein
MGVPFNELNRVLDLGFKPLAWGDRGYVGSKLQEVGNGGTKPADETAVPLRVLERHRVVDQPEPMDAMSRAEALLGGLKAGHVSALHRQLLSKLQRFNFEQRGRVLGKLAEQLDGTTGGGQLKPDLVLDVPDENALLAERLQPVLGKETSAEAISAAIDRSNQTRLEQLRETFAQALALGESREQLITRVKTLFTQQPGPGAFLNQQGK